MLWDAPVSCFSPQERLRVPPGPVHGGGDAGRVLRHGAALVRGRHRPLHHPRQQPQSGVGQLGAGGTAQIFGDPRAESHRLDDLRAHGLLRLPHFDFKGGGKM